MLSSLLLFCFEHRDFMQAGILFNLKQAGVNLVTYWGKKLAGKIVTDGVEGLNCDQQAGSSWPAESNRCLTS